MISVLGSPCLNCRLHKQVVALTTHHCPLYTGDMTAWHLLTSMILQVKTSHSTHPYELTGSCISWHALMFPMLTYTVCCHDHLPVCTCTVNSSCFRTYHTDWMTVSILGRGRGGFSPLFQKSKKFSLMGTKVHKKRRLYCTIGQKFLGLHFFHSQKFPFSMINPPCFFFREEGIPPHKSISRIDTGTIVSFILCWRFYIIHYVCFP